MIERVHLGVAVLLVSTAAGVVSGASTEEPAVDQFRIVFHDEQGNPVDPDALFEIEGRVGYQIVSDRTPDPEAQKLHAEGRAAAQQGDHDRALELLAAASKLDPEWPYPVYDAAFTHLLQGNPAEAERHYRQVAELAPRGFFTTHVAVDSLRREREGLIPSGVYLAFVMLEWEEDADKKRSVLMAMLEDGPEFPAAWQLLASMTDDAEQRMHAIEQGLSHSPDAKTRGDLLIQKALGLVQTGENGEAVEILRRVLSDSECTLDNEAIARIVLGQVAE
jgi:tetratricopeptide (TPR) repeat protein